MFKACYSEEARSIDLAALEQCSIPSIVLMENAAIACVNEIKKELKSSKQSVAIFCGRGNNGGDGLAIARHLFNNGINVSVFLVAGTNFKNDAKTNFDIVNSMDIPIDIITETDNLQYLISSFDIIVDAILGTGINRVIMGITFDVINYINDYARFVISVDIPSGINSDNGEICGICIKSDKTVTFGAYKIGMFLYPAADYTGKIIIDPISIPKSIIEANSINVNVTDSFFVKQVTGKRENNSHKSNYGKLLIIAGSIGMSGAAYMASEAAVKSGAGLVTLLCPECINGILESKTTEVMTVPLEDNKGHFSISAIDKILEYVDKVDAVLLGPGLGRSDDCKKIVYEILHNSKVPIVIDADAINAISENKSVLKDCACEIIFTPHTIEMSRLSNLNPSYIEGNRLEVSKEFSEENGAVLLLKGHHTIVTAPTLEQYINITGNPGLASGGSGDVLSGIIASFVSRGIDPTKAAAAGAYIHGLAGDLAANDLSVESLTATNIIEYIPKAFCEILQVDK